MDAAELEMPADRECASETAWVLYVAGDDAVGGPLAIALGRRAFEVVVRTTLGDAIDVVRKRTPACIVCDADLRAGVGLEIARTLREERGLAGVPLVCTSSNADRRIEALHLTADAVLSSNMAPDAAASQIAALVRLGERLQAGPRFRVPGPHTLTGDTSVVPLSAFLMALAYENRSGVLELLGAEEEAHVELVDGKAISGGVGEQKVTALEALRTMLAWGHGRFAFTAFPLHGAPDGALELRALCIEATRLLDEQGRDTPSTPQKAVALPLAAAG